MQTARALPPPSAQLLCQRINWQICHKKSIARAEPIKTELPLHGRILKVACADCGWLWPERIRLPCLYRLDFVAKSCADVIRRPLLAVDLDKEKHC